MNLHNSSSYFDVCALEIVKHFESLQEIEHGKAVVIVRDIEAGCLFLKSILALRPNWREDDIQKMVVSTISSADSIEKNDFKLKLFQDQNSSLSLLVGTGSYLVGYDNRYINTVYVTCPISNQLQYRIAALVSRHNHAKLDGKIIDFVGIDWSIE